MGFELVITKKAINDLSLLDSSIAKRIVKKLFWFAQQEKMTLFAVMMKENSSGDFRFRIGDYRAIGVYSSDHTRIMIVSIGHRSKIYR